MCSTTQPESGTVNEISESRSRLTSPPRFVRTIKRPAFVPAALLLAEGILLVICFKDRVRTMWTSVYNLSTGEFRIAYRRNYDNICSGRLEMRRPSSSCHSGRLGQNAGGPRHGTALRCDSGPTQTVAFTHTFM